MAELEAPIAAMIDATNREDPAAFLAAFAPDAVLVDWGTEYAGRERIAAWDRTDNTGVHSRFEVRDASRIGDVTTVTVQVTGEGYNGGSAFDFRTADGLITRMDITGRQIACE